MTDEKIERLKRVLERGIGAEIAVRVDKGGLRTGLRAHFAELGAHGGPICTIRPSGLRRHLVNLRFGDYAGPCIRQIQNADYERQATARGLLKGIAISHELKFRPEQAVESWVVRDGSFNVEVVVRDVADYDSADSVAHTATEVMVPMLAAMAELIGYDEFSGQTAEIEGAVTEVLIKRRERSRRNRYLCLSVHGNRCAACGLDPLARFGDAGNIIEVHHLEPVSLLDMPREYDPFSDLIPLCPNCHRLIHSRRPVPLSLTELKELLENGPG